MDEVEHFKKRLLSLQQKLTRRIAAIDRDIRHEDLSSDWGEQATERENDEVLESLGNASEMELARIKEALKRIEDGEYFYCRVCGEEIPLARLQLLPFTTTCVNCADQIEKKRG